MQYKILMSLMGLDIGGAETHVVELAKELKKQGFDIVIASNGGVYVKEIEDYGIKHYAVPMNKRNAINLLKSYFLLQKIIKNENIDIVHSHARIPSFICGLLHKKMKFPFVTSAHWVFNTGMGLKYVTNWGQKVVAVSNDIKDYLKTNYGISDKDIFVTINGIDTEKFSPNTDKSKIMKEFSLNENAPIITYVSRMDADRALVAKQLIEIAPRLCKKIEGLQILIVGGGNVFDEMNSLADNTNNIIGHRAIKMTNSRTDINELVACCDIFIGVSRATLEAMSAKKPVIVAGNEGYIGIFSKDTIEISKETNFCCRGCEDSSGDFLFNDIVKLFNDEGYRDELGEYGRETIISDYSVSKMAGDCIDAYNASYYKTHTKRYNVLISGYYGFNNSGDEAILLSMYNNIEKMGDNIDITILSKNPEETKDKFNVEVIPRFNFFKVIKSLKKCDVLLSGGGSLLQDTTSTRSLIYYLSIILGAKFFRKKVMLYANGIGPVSKNVNRNLVKWVVSKANVITLREESSYEELINMGVKNKKSFITADPVFTMDAISKEKSLEILDSIGVPTDKGFVGISVRNWKNLENFSDELAKTCDYIKETYDKTIVFITMQVPNDIDISEKVQSKMKFKSYILKNNYSPFEIMGIISLMDFILSMRLHTLIFAARQNIPLIGFIYDPKIEYYLKKLDMPSGGTLNDFTLRAVKNYIDDIVNDRDKYVEVLTEKSKQLEIEANLNEKYLLELLKE